MVNEEIINRSIEFRRHFHRFPEVSTQEIETQAYIINILKENGIDYKTYETGIIAVIGQGEPCVAIRADMDALWVHEETGLPYASEYEGKMHACGHDMHMYMVLGA